MTTSSAESLTPTSPPLPNQGLASIARIRATPVNVPLEAPYRWSVGLFPGFTKTIVEVETSDGAIGVGEAPNWQAARMIEDHIARRLVGANPYDLADCERRCIPPLRVLLNTDDALVVRAYGGVEMALWDLVGQIEGRSIASLLGGRVRNRVAFSEYFALRVRQNRKGGEETPADVARYCARMVEEHDSPAFEGKVGVGDIATDVAIVREVRSAIGDRTLRLDANMSWTTTQARLALRQFENYGVESVEEPVGTLEELARLRHTTSIAFSSHDPNLKAASYLGVPDAFVINLTALGGIRRSVAFVAACEALGIDVWFYSPDTCIANAAYLQVGAACEWLSKPSQTLLRWHADHLIEGGTFVPKAGHVEVPSGPGLGVKLDRAALKRCHQRFVDDGPYDQYSDPVRDGRYIRTDLR